jgi:hypothetical protein
MEVMIMNEMNEEEKKEMFFDYEVIKNDHPDSNIAYYLKRRKSVIGLIRFANNSQILYATNSKWRGCKVNDYCHFTDKDGRLTAIVITADEKRALLKALKS